MSDAVPQASVSLCPHCQGPPGTGRFCLTCGVLRRVLDTDLQLASHWHRLVGFLVDALLIVGSALVLLFGLVVLLLSQLSRSGFYQSLAVLLLLVVGTWVGWLVWLAIVARRSQSPGKWLLGMYILRGDGTPASAKRVWLREVVMKWLLFGAAGWLLGGVGGLVLVADGLWIFGNLDRQTLHDKLADTIVVSSPGGLVAVRLLQIEGLRDEGLITQYEYEERRSRLMRRM